MRAAGCTQAIEVGSIREGNGRASTQVGWLIVQREQKQREQKQREPKQGSQQSAMTQGVLPHSPALGKLQRLIANRPQRLCEVSSIVQLSDGHLRRLHLLRCEGSLPQLPCTEALGA